MEQRAIPTATEFPIYIKSEVSVKFDPGARVIYKMLSPTHYFKLSIIAGSLDVMERDMKVVCQVFTEYCIGTPEYSLVKESDFHDLYKEVMAIMHIAWHRKV